MNEKRFRFDLLIAVSALLISTIAALASVYQTRVINQQLSATVWPYLSFDSTFGPRSVTLSVTNFGLGPALIRAAGIELDGKPVPAWDNVIRAVVQLAHGMHVHGQIPSSYSNLDASVVISPGVTRQLLDMRVAGGDTHAVGMATKALRTVVSEVSLRVCYCSLLGQCWQIASRQMGSPAPQSSCPIGVTIGAGTSTP
jgi:hypothetical protein